MRHPIARLRRGELVAVGERRHRNPGPIHRIAIHPGQQFMRAIERLLAVRVSVKRQGFVIRIPSDAMKRRR
jgi:hypothetical protein